MPNSSNDPTTPSDSQEWFWRGIALGLTTARVMCAQSVNSDKAVQTLVWWRRDGERLIREQERRVSQRLGILAVDGEQEYLSW